jgi:Plavaka transposase
MCSDICALGGCAFDDSTKFWTFKHQLYHASIAAVLRPLRAGMINPVVRRCPDGHFQRVIYDLIAYIADYPEQVLLSGIVQGWCPK